MIVRSKVFLVIDTAGATPDTDLEAALANPQRAIGRQFFFTQKAAEDHRGSYPPDVKAQLVIVPANISLGSNNKSKDDTLAP